MILEMDDGLDIIFWKCHPHLFTTSESTLMCDQWRQWTPNDLITETDLNLLPLWVSIRNLDLEIDETTTTHRVLVEL